MCLVTVNKYPNKACTDILVYKIFIVKQDKKGKKMLYPPIMTNEVFYPYSYGTVLKPKRIPFIEKILICFFRLFGKNFAVKEVKDPITKAICNYYKVRESYLHCINSFHRESLKEMMEGLICRNNNNCYQIFRCHIPKGTKYYMSLDGKYLAAKKLILIP